MTAEEQQAVTEQTAQPGKQAPGGFISERTVRTPDGRILAVQESGHPAGRPVLVHMGTPMSRHLYRPVREDAAQRGLRLISYDRPGIGGSTPRPGRTVADTAADLAAICATLDIDRIAVCGVSGGGPNALACAALLPGLVAAAASLASLAPYGAEGLDWFDGMGQDNVDGFRQFLTDRAAARAEYEQDRQEALAADPDGIAELFKSLLAPADAAVITGELAEYLAFTQREALAPGWEGWWEDDCAQTDPWGFDLADIRVPVLVLHGRQDKFVPFGHGQWLAAHVPGAEAWLLDDDGHLTLTAHRIPEVHSWLAQRL
jgi:pimeloyl-ACP methyl ester carboxylesterase